MTGPIQGAREPHPDSDGVPVTIVVCDSCRKDEPGAPVLLGANLLANTRAAASAPIRVKSVACLGNCKRRLSAALLKDGAWNYVFGDLSEDSGADLVEGAKLFAATSDALLPWRGRPESLKRGLVARIPPRSLIEDIA